ncbi:Splicing factor-like protein 1 [Bienertia sinuspersici]
MSAKVDPTTVQTQLVQTAAATSPSKSSVGGTRVSMFKGKAGFVIPKNKFSGSLVPVFKGAKKSESSDAAIDESSRQSQRKTKWGPDPTQDTSVRRGRALAYQTRVDQITQQLKSGSIRSDSESSKSARDVTDSEPPPLNIEFEKLQSLELERREAIGEILKLNPSYKVPFDYQPVVREAIVPIPVKEHPPDYNFLGLVYGSDGGTQKRLEKETGTRIQVCGTKSETKEKVEITASDGNELISSCEEVYVRISSDTYEKVDAAAALIEMLFSSVSVKPAASTVSSSASGDNAQALSGGQETATTHAISTAMANQELQAGSGPVLTSSQGPFQPYPSSWLPAGQSNSPSGPVPISSSMAFPFNPSFARPYLGPGPPAPYGFGSSQQSTAAPMPRLQTSTPGMPGTFMSPAYPFGQAVPMRNLSTTTSSSPLIGHQPTSAGSPRVPLPQLADRTFTPPRTPPGWIMPPAGSSQPLSSGSFPTIGSSQGSMASQPNSVSPTPQFRSPQSGPIPAMSFVHPQMRSSSPMPAQSVAHAPQGQLLNPSTNSSLRPQHNSLPPSSTHAPSFTPLKHMGPTAPGSTLPRSGDFTFQPHRPQGAPSQSHPGPGMHFAPQRPAPPSLPHAPQGPSFRPALQNTVPQNVRQNFPGPPIGNQVGPSRGQYGSPNPNPHMGPRHLGSAALGPNSGGPFPPRGGHSVQYQQSYPAPPLNRPGGNFSANLRPSPSGRPQVYDPFSPTSISAAQPQGNNTGNANKQDDPDYEDLMASVGVK